MSITSYTTNPGTVKFLNKYLMPSENYIVCAALVAEDYDVVTTPERRHYSLLEEMVQKGHWGCLDHCSPTFRIDMPIFTARQFMRASNSKFNETSGRYKVLKPFSYMPEVFYKDVPRKKLDDEPIPFSPEEQEKIGAIYMEAVDTAWESYEEMIQIGVRKEQARMVLGLNTYTSVWASLPLSDWLHFLNLRTDDHAQLEIQWVADDIMTELIRQFPNIMSYWLKYAKGPINEYGTIQTP